MVKMIMIKAKAIKMMTNTHSSMSSVTSSMWLKERSSQAISSGASTRSRASCDDYIAKFSYLFCFQTFKICMRFFYSCFQIFTWYNPRVSTKLLFANRMTLLLYLATLCIFIFELCSVFVFRFSHCIWVCTRLY